MWRLVLIMMMANMLLMLSGCEPIYKREYSYEPPRSRMGNMCIAQCMQGKNMCEQMCQMRNDNCHSQARQNAIYEYENYKRERHHRGERVDKEVQDFDRGYLCNTSCNCTPSFNACYSACGGQVQEHQVCIAFCDKA